MDGAFQKNAFQNDAFQVADEITSDGDGGIVLPLGGRLSRNNVTFAGAMSRSARPKLLSVSALAEIGDIRPGLFVRPSLAAVDAFTAIGTIVAYRNATARVYSVPGFSGRGTLYPIVTSPISDELALLLTMVN